MSEPFAYRETLQDILEFTGGRRKLTVAEVGRYTGMKDYRTIHRQFPYFENGVIYAPTLAKLMCEGGAKKR